MEQVNCLVLEGQKGAHLSRQTAGVSPSIRCLRVLHQHLQQGHVRVACGRVKSNQDSLIAAYQVLEDVEDGAFVIMCLGRGLEQADEGRDEHR